MKVWCDALTFTAKGKVAGTYDFVTANTIEIKSRANNVIGIIASAVISKPTAGISAMPILRWTSDDLGIANQERFIGGLGADAPATNEVEEPLASSFIALDYSENVGGAKVEFSISTSSAQTAGYDGCIGLVYADGPPDINFRMELLAKNTGPTKGSKTALAAAAITAASETAFTNKISVSSKANELRGLLSACQGNAPAADDPLAGYTSYLAPAMDDFSPQKWPFCVATQGILGTPADSAPIVPTFYWPTRFDMPNVNFDISVAQKASVAQNAAADGSAGACWH